MDKKLISVSVDELKDAEQEMKEFVAEKYLRYLSACEETMSRRYKITERDKKALFDEVMKAGKTTEEIDRENLDSLIRGIHFSTEQICEYIADSEYFKDSFGLMGASQYAIVIEEGAAREAFIGKLKSCMSFIPNEWDFSDLPETEDTTTHTAEELLEAEKGLLQVIEEIFTDAALEGFDELMEEYRPDDKTLSELEQYADNAFLEGMDIEDFEDRVYELTFDDLKMAEIKVSVSDVLNYIKEPETVEKNFYTFITEDYKKAYIRKQYAIRFFSDMYEDDLNDTEDTEE